MFKSLFRRMAPLVAGVLVAAQTIAVYAAFPYITNIGKSGNTVTVSVQNPPPSGYAVPRNPSANYYWWIDQNYDGYGSMSYDPGVSFTNACVYVYPAVGSDYSYAIHDTINGVSIWNGP